MINHLQATYQHDSETVARLIAGELILVPIRKNVGEMDNIYTLNETAARIWELVDGQRSVADVLQQMVDEYDIDPIQAEKDVLDLFNEFIEKGVLVEK